MIKLDEDALACDLAETYGIYDYEELPLDKVALFAVGLREDSRIKQKISGVELSLTNYLLAAAVDRLTILAYSKTKDAAKGNNRPELILSKLVKDKAKTQGFISGKDFERERERIIRQAEKR